LVSKKTGKKLKFFKKIAQKLVFAHFLGIISTQNHLALWFITAYPRHKRSNKAY